MAGHRRRRRSSGRQVRPRRLEEVARSFASGGSAGWRREGARGPVALSRKGGTLDREPYSDCQAGRPAALELHSLKSTSWRIRSSSGVNSIDIVAFRRQHAEQACRSQQIRSANETLGVWDGGHVPRGDPTRRPRSRELSRAMRGRTGVDLGTLNGGSFSVATAINPAGKVVGLQRGGGGDHRFSELRLSMEERSSHRSRLARRERHQSAGHNPRGQVVGTSSTTQGLGHAFLWDKGVMTDLGPGEATAINPAGQVVGTNFAPHAVLWAKQAVTDLGTLGGC